MCTVGTIATFALPVIFVLEWLRLELTVWKTTKEGERPSFVAIGCIVLTFPIYVFTDWKCY